MSISSEINRISQNVSDSLTAVAAKGVTVPSGANSDDLPTLIASIQTGGGSSEPWSWIGEEVESLGTLYEEELTLDDTSFPSWTATTTASSILATANVATFQADMKDHDYFINWKCLADIATNSGATLKAQIIRESQSAWQALFRRPNGVTNIQSGTFNANTTLTLFTGALLLYYNTSGAEAYNYSNTYGIYQAVQAPTFSNGTSNTPTVTIKRPMLYARCNDSYFATARKADVDTANSTIRLTCEVFKVPIGGIVRSVHKQVIDLVNE